MHSIRLFLILCLAMAAAGGLTVVVAFKGDPETTRGGRPVDILGTAVLGGFVTNGADGRPVGGVTLTLLNYRDRSGAIPKCTTDPDGHFHFLDLPASGDPLYSVRLRAVRGGFLPSNNYTTLGSTSFPVVLEPDD